MSARKPMRRAAQPAMHVVAPLGEQLRDECARGRFLEREFRVRVDTAAHVDEFGRDGGDAGNDGFD